MCILLYIYGSYFLELGEDIELFCVVQDFCLVTVQYINKLPDSVIGIHRNILIEQCHLLKCPHYIPKNVHKAIRWNKKDPMLEPDTEFLPWQIIVKKIIIKIQLMWSHKVTKNM